MDIHKYIERAQEICVRRYNMRHSENAYYKEKEKKEEEEKVTFKKEKIWLKRNGTKEYHLNNRR